MNAVGWLILDLLGYERYKCVQVLFMRDERDNLLKILTGVFFFITFCNLLRSFYLINVCNYDFDVWFISDFKCST